MALALMNLVLLWLALPEAPRSAAAVVTSPPGELRRRAAPLLLVGLVTTMATVLVEQTIAFSYEDVLGLRHEETPTFVGGALVAYGVVAVFTQGWLVRRATLPPGVLLGLGVPLTLLSMLGLVAADGFVTLTLALMLQALGQGLVLPAVSAGLSLTAKAGEQGPVMGLHNAAQGMGRFLGPLVGPSLYGVERTLPYATSAAMLGAVLALVLLTPRLRTLRASAPDAALL